MKKIIALIFCSGLLLNIHGQKPKETEDWSRKPDLVTPGKGSLPPSDAIVLYGGAGDLDLWESEREGPAKWIAGEELTVVTSTGGIKTKQSFGDMQVHVEWRSPAEVKGDGQDRGNSGFFLMGKYEVQVLDSYNSLTYYNGQAGSIYKQTIPLVNACLPPGEWQTYDIIFKAPVFNEDGSKKSSAYVTVIHNGVLIQNHVEILGTTEYIGAPKNVAHAHKLPISLQDHDHPVSYRNIWVREL
jgi:hypothetical protein